MVASGDVLAEASTDAPMAGGLSPTVASPLTADVGVCAHAPRICDHNSATRMWQRREDLKESSHIVFCVGGGGR